MASGIAHFPCISQPVRFVRQCMLHAPGGRGPLPENAMFTSVLLGTKRLRAMPSRWQRTCDEPFA